MPASRRCAVTAFPLLVEVSAAAAQAGRRLVFLRRVDAPRLLEETERLLQVAFETAPIGMAFFTTEGVYLRVNAALCRLLDRPAGDLLGRRDQEFTQPTTERPTSLRRGGSSRARSTPGRRRSASSAPTAAPCGSSRT
jgi:PAS domain-containing protein